MTDEILLVVATLDREKQANILVIFNQINIVTKRLVVTNTEPKKQ